MRAITEVVGHPQMAARQRWTSVDTSVGPVATLQEAADDLGTPEPGRAPSLGEHTDAWRRELER